MNATSIKIKRFVKALTAAVAVLAVCALTSCSLAYSFDCSQDGKNHYGVSKRDAFYIMYEWDGSAENMTVEVPDEFKGVPVTELGGYVGRGFPSPFSVSLPQKFRNSAYSLTDDEVSDADLMQRLFPQGYKIVDLTFTVRLGKNVKKLRYGHINDYCNSEESGMPAKLYHIKYRYECSGENSTYYSMGGELYDAADGSPAQWDKGV